MDLTRPSSSYWRLSFAEEPQRVMSPHGQTRTWALGDRYGMNGEARPRIVSAERLSNSVVITFDNGQCAEYSASLLHDTLPQARLLLQSSDESEDDVQAEAFRDGYSAVRRLTD